MVNEADDPFEGEAEDEMFAHRERRDRDREPGWQKPRVVSDFVRRAIENTMGAAQNTGSISRDALQYLLQQGDRGKKEVLRIVAHEVSDFLKNVDLSSEVIKVLTSLQVEVNASIRFKPSPDHVLGVKPEIKQQTELKTSPESGPGPVAAPPPPVDPDPTKPPEGA